MDTRLERVPQFGEGGRENYEKAIAGSDQVTCALRIPRSCQTAQSLQRRCRRTSGPGAMPAAFAMWKAWLELLVEGV